MRNLTRAIKYIIFGTTKPNERTSKLLILIRFLAKRSRTTWIGLLIPPIIVTAWIFLGATPFPSPTFLFNRGDGGVVSLLVILIGFVIFIGGLLYRSSVPNTSAYLMRWVLGTVAYLGYLFLFEIPVWSYLFDANPSTSNAWPITFFLFYPLIAIISLIEGSIIFILWRLLKKR